MEYALTSLAALPPITTTGDILESISDALYVLDRRWRFTYLNQRACNILQHAADDLLGHNVWDEFPDVVGSVFDTEFHRAMADGVAVTFEVDYRRLGGWFELRVHPSSEGLTVFFQDINARKNREREMAAAEARYRSLVEQVPAVIYTEMHESHVQYVSPQIEHLTGYTAEEWLAQPDLWLEITHPDDRARVLAEVARTDATGAPYRIEYRYITRDGRVIWIRNEADLVRDVHGEPLFWQGIITDITDAKRAERTTAELAAIIASSTDAIIVADRKGVLTAWNQGAEALYGYTAAEAVGQPASMVAPADRRAAFEKARAAILAGGASVHIESVHQRQDGALVDVALTISVIRDAAGDVIGTAAIGHAITARKAAEARQQLLTSISDVLGASLDVERTLQQVAQQIVPHMADWCTISLLDRDGVLTRSAVVHADPAKAALAEELRQHPFDPDATYGMPLTVRSGRSLLESDLTEAAWASPMSADYVRVQRALGMTSLINVPLIARGKILGGIGFVSGDAGRRYTTDDLVLAEEIARRAAIAIDNAQLYRSTQVAEAEYRTLVEQMPAVLYRVPLGGSATDLYVSPQIEQLIDYTVDDWRSSETFRHENIHPADRPHYMAEVARTDQTHEVFDLEYRYLSKTGEPVWVRNLAHVIVDDAGNPAAWQGFITSIDRQKRAEMALRESEQRFRRMFDDAAIGTAVLGLDGRIQAINPALCAMAGYRTQDLISRSSLELVHPDDRHITPPYLQQLLQGAIPSFAIEERLLHGDGSWLWCLVHIAAVHDDAGRPLYTLAHIQDISTRKELESQLRHQALHDALTGLPNRALLLDRLNQEVTRARRGGPPPAILFVDLDNFKVINDSLGHAAGDVLLVAVARRLRELVREIDTVARFGGDEFVIVLGAPVDAAGAIDVAHRINAAMTQPFRIQGRSISVTTSIGIATGLDAQIDRNDLLRHADIALYRAKARGKNTFELFDDSMHAAAIRRLELESELREALVRSEFALHYQPKIALQSGAIVGAEALVRWLHPTRGMISPMEFIPIAEETGLILALGAWIVREACGHGAEYLRHYRGHEPFTISINLSGRQFAQPDLVELFTAVLQDTGLPPANLTIEITESVAMGDAETTIARLQQLKGLGVNLSVDDFGTGYSSLAYLQRFPVDVLKIDRSFIAQLGEAAAATAIVTAMISLAHTLGLRVVAEGVETLQQLQVLRNLGCDRAQGYYFSKPIPSAAFAALLDSDES